jgi:uncharacterized protein with PQ loop repeat
VATLVVVISYFTRKPVTLRRIQAVGACLWLAYGILIHASPVIAANIIVAAAALISSWRGPAAQAAKA